MPSACPHPTQSSLEKYTSHSPANNTKTGYHKPVIIQPRLPIRILPLVAKRNKRTLLGKFSGFLCAYNYKNGSLLPCSPHASQSVPQWSAIIENALPPINLAIGAKMPSSKIQAVRFSGNFNSCFPFGPTGLKGAPLRSGPFVQRHMAIPHKVRGLPFGGFVRQDKSFFLLLNGWFYCYKHLYKSIKDGSWTVKHKYGLQSKFRIIILTP